MHFIRSCIKNIYIKLKRSAIHCKVQPNVCVSGAVEFRSNGLRGAPSSVTVSITPVCWQMRSLGCYTAYSGYNLPLFTV